MKSAFNPVFSKTIGRCVWGELYQKEEMLLEEKFHHILKRTSILYVLACVAFAAVARNPYILLNVPIEHIILHFSHNLYDWWVDLIFHFCYIVLVLWYVQPLLLLVFAETYVEGVPALFMVATYPIRTLIVPPIIFAFIASYSFICVILGGSFIHILRLVQAIILYELQLFSPT